MKTFSLLRRYSIRSRMLALLGVTALMLVAVGAAGLFGLKQVDDIGARFVSTSHAATLRSAELAMALGDVRRYEKDMILSYEKAAAVAEYKAKWQGALTRAQALSEQLGQGSGGDAQAAKDIASRLAAYAVKSGSVVRQLEGEAYDNAATANRLLTPAKEEVRAAESSFRTLTASLQQHSEESRAEAGKATRLAYIGFAVVVVTALLLVGALTMVNTLSICGPIDEARQATERIAAGDLSATIEARGHDEAAGLLRSVQGMQTVLRDLVGQVHASSQSILGASAEVASGNMDLSQRTEQAASSLQHTASAVEQLTATVGLSAASASQASQLAGSAAEVARRGGTAVAQVVSTMQGINDSSRRIADIVGTIDGIAFQTNILALNAAVEAARAGEQGRGFAVVASEVRSLAQRSAGAAREIKNLIGASVERVEAGSRQVVDAGHTMTEIVASVQRVNDIITEISSAAAEQSQGIGQVNGAVADLDRMTQQNAALVEQSAAAAESLKDQAQRMSLLVATFRLQPAH